MNTEKFQKSDYYENLMNAISEEGDSYSGIEKKFHCEIDCNKEKHNQLQYTYYFTITSPLMKGTMYIEMENGINNGSQINDISFENDLMPKSRTIEVIKDVVLDEKRVVENGFSLIKAKAVFPRYKNQILELNKKQGYDDYVTGGGTNKTDNFYKNQFDKIREIGLFWKYIYEEIEVGLTLV
jgi:hypothetical protein